jgi:phage shock protein A
MGVFNRMSLIFRSKANKAMDKMEDPRETLDYSYSKQLELLQKVRRGVADVATSRKRLELQIARIKQESDKLHAQAQKALAVGREDLAREALTRRSGLEQQISDLATQHAALQAEEEKLTLAAQRLQARAGAVDELLASGALDDVTGTSKDDITLELERMASTSDVELELTRMKAQLEPGTSASTPAIEVGEAGEPGVAGGATDASESAQPRPEGGQS